jgi:hypothetical protein
MARKSKTQPKKTRRIQFNEETLMWYVLDVNNNKDFSQHNKSLADALAEEGKRRDTKEMVMFKLLTSPRYASYTEKQTLVKHFPHLLSALPDQEAVKRSLLSIFEALTKMMMELGEAETITACVERWNGLVWKDYTKDKLQEDRGYRLLSNLLARHKVENTEE